MTAPILALVPIDARREPEQLLLRPFWAMTEAATRCPAAARYWCRNPAARNEWHPPLAWREGGVVLDLFDRIARPRTFGECSRDPGPCPWVTCRHHLAIDVGPRGALKIAFPGKEVDELAETCSLRVSGRGDHTEEEIARLLGVSSERISQISMAAQRKYEAGIRKLRVFEDLTEGEWR
jgi:hypothetical protein